MDSFLGSNKSLTRVFRQSGMSSGWFAQSSPWFTAFCFLSNLLCVCIILLEFGVLLWVDYDAVDLAAWATMINVNACGLIASYCSYAFEGKMRRLVQNFDLTSELLTSFEDYEFPEDNFIRLGRKFIDVYSSYTVAATCFATACYHSPVWIKDLLDNCYRSHLVYKIYLPYSYNTTGLYEFTWTFQALGFIVPAIKKGSVEILVLCLLHQQVKHVACLRLLVDKVLKSRGKIVGLKKWFRLHQLTMKNYQEINQIQAPVTAMNYLNVVTLTACILFIGTQDQRLSFVQILGAWVYFLFAVTEIFLVCALFEKVSNEITSIGDGIYNSDWHLMTKEVTGTLRFTMSVVQQPLASAYCSEVLRVDHRSFLNTLRSIISTYLAFIKLEEIALKGKLG